MNAVKSRYIIVHRPDLSSAGWTLFDNLGPLYHRGCVQELVDMLCKVSGPFWLEVSSCGVGSETAPASSQNTPLEAKQEADTPEAKTDRSSGTDPA